MHIAHIFQNGFRMHTHLRNSPIDKSISLPPLPHDLGKFHDFSPQPLHCYGYITEHKKKLLRPDGIRIVERSAIISNDFVDSSGLVFGLAAICNFAALAHE